LRRVLRPNLNGRSRFRDRSRRGNASRSKLEAAGRSDKIANGKTVSDRRAASNRGNGVNALKKAVNKVNLGAKTQNRAASRLGPAANAQIKSASKSNHAAKARSETPINPNDAKVADNEVGEGAEGVEINATTNGKAIVAVAEFAMESRIASVGGDASVNRIEKFDRRKTWKKPRPNPCLLMNRSKSRRP
jgi:hypothetical protein